VTRLALVLLVEAKESELLLKLKLPRLEVGSVKGGFGGVFSSLIFGAGNYQHNI
jgi:hypothetical protein